jgi:hypothetical protein
MKELPGSGRRRKLTDVGSARIWKKEKADRCRKRQDLEKEKAGRCRRCLADVGSA